MIGAFFDRLRDIARRRRWNPDLALGRRGEDLAHRFLRREGYTIVARNYRSASQNGEADLIAWDSGTLVIVEVKTRRSADFGPPDRAIGEEKRHHLRRVGRAYAHKTDTPLTQLRFDEITVIDSGGGSRPVIQLSRNAFSI